MIAVVVKPGTLTTASGRLSLAATPFTKPSGVVTSSAPIHTVFTSTGQAGFASTGQGV